MPSKINQAEKKKGKQRFAPFPLFYEKDKGYLTELITALNASG